VVEDAAQAFGASFDGRRVGTWGQIGCFSFFPTKPLGGFGDGGMLVTDDPALAARCRSLRAHGATGKHQHAEVGGNYRLDAVQAALLRVKLPHVDRYRQARAAHAAAYAQGLADVPEIIVPKVPSSAESAHALFTVRVQDGQRDALARALEVRGIQTAVYYPRPLHLQLALVSEGYREGQFPNAERACQEVLSLPLFAEMSEADRTRVIEAIREHF
jgi:dTDP-4-amino-4,6-dideoxygalactose transaminase